MWMDASCQSTSYSSTRGQEDWSHRPAQHLSGGTCQVEVPDVFWKGSQFGRGKELNASLKPPTDRHWFNLQT